MTDLTLTAGDLTQVNTLIGTSERTPKIATLTGGGYVITWCTRDASVGLVEVHAQRYDAAGEKLGSEVQVNTTDSIGKANPAVAALADGGYVITWNGSGSQYEIWMQRYDADGAAVGSETQVNTYTTSEQSTPSITSLADGGWLISWQSNGQDGDAFGIYGQRYNAAGAVVGNELHLTDRTTVHQSRPVVASLSDGGFIVVFDDYAGGLPSYDVYAQRYDSESNKVGSDVMISVPVDNRLQNTPDVIGMDDGGYLVVWQSRYQDGDDYGIYSRRYDSSGTAITGEVLVNTTTASAQQKAHVTLLSNGGYVIVWQTETLDPMRFTFKYDVFAQVFDVDGAKVGGELKVNSFAYVGSSTAATPDVTATDNGGFIVTFAGYGSGSTSDVNIFSVTYTDPNAPKTLTGDSGANTLDGTGIVAHMAGLGGNDSYVVDGVSDLVTEAAAAGSDTVSASIAYTLGDNVENLTLTGSGAIDGTGNGLDNVITGNDGNNSLYGLGGNDRLDGGTGTNALHGGTGDDTYVVNSANDTVTEASGAGTDTVESAVQYALGDNVENLILTGSSNFDGGGNALDNVITGNAGDNVLYGHGGNDTLDGAGGSNIMQGGEGDDTYIVRASSDYVLEWTGQGTDTVLSAMTYALDGGLDNLTLTGSDNLNGTGNDTGNILIGNGGNNRLDGGSGADSMSGGAGDDTYVVADAGDQVTEAEDKGTDTVVASVNFTLGANIENLTLTTNQVLIGVGNALNNVLVGGTGANVLDGQGGDDTMSGGEGGDTFIVESTGDTVNETAGEGQDWIYTSVSYTAAENVEFLILTGTDNIDGTAASTALYLKGNAGNNNLTGSSENDTLAESGGEDTLIGGAGNDSYVVNSDGDVVVEDISNGLDSVAASITYVLTDNVENLTLTGTDVIDGTGNGLANTMVGNDAANSFYGMDGNDRIDGGAGADTMFGGKGNDVYYVDNADDTVSEQTIDGTDDGGIDCVRTSLNYTLVDFVEKLVLTGSDNVIGTGNGLGNTLHGNSGDNTLYGLDGADILNGGAGSDLMYGGAGDDTYYVEDNGDVASEETNAGVDDGGCDTVQSTVSYELGNSIENLSLTGTWNISGSGNGLDNLLYGNSGANTLYGHSGNDALNGGSGADAMYGGAGNDTYSVDQAGDLASEQTVSGVDDGGIDYVRASVSFVLGDFIEKLVLTGTGDSSGSGNALDNAISGNSGANTLYGLDGADSLNGGTGADTMYGGAGNDTYYVDNAGDVVNEQTVSGVNDGGVDQVRTSISYVLGEFVEKMVLTGSGNISGTGNALGNGLSGNSGANTLYGLDGNDSLNGAGGADIMYGGSGNDTYYVDNVGDVASEQTVAGTDDGGLDTVQSSASFTIDAYIEKLILTGSGNISGIGNGTANTLYGNTGDNILDGMGGNDTLTGGAGADTFRIGVDSGLDTIRDFHVAEGDVLDLSAYGDSSAAVFTQVGANVRIDLGSGNIVTVQNVLASNADFLAHITW